MSDTVYCGLGMLVTGAISLVGSYALDGWMQHACRYVFPIIALALAVLFFVLAREENKKKRHRR